MSEPGIQLRGMILAAGYGSRLAPLTDHIPKPLLPVGGTPLLDHAITALVAAGIEQIAVNTHHLGPMVASYLEGRPDVGRFHISPEIEILGTGGALAGARDFLSRADHFVIFNGDVLCDVNLSGLVDEHLRTGAVATMLLVDWPAVNSVALDTAGAVCRIGGDQLDDDPSWRRLTYTGIGVFRRDFLDDIGPGFSSLIDPIVRAKDLNPGSVRGFAPAGLNWSDLGTPARYLEAVSPEDWPPGGALYIEPITGHGSARRFWRLGGEGFSLVAMVSPADDIEFERFCAIGRWLNAAGLGAPEVFAVNEAENSVLMEDVGKESLLSLAGGDQTRAAYEKVVDHLLVLQDRTAAALNDCPLAVDRTLDTAMLRWETDYFRERFLVSHCGLDSSAVNTLTPEFEALASAVAKQPVVLIHRDFQSQNIHLQDGQVRLIDFQGMRLGPVGYDIMSLVMDPYVDLPQIVRDDLRNRFCQEAAGTHSRQELWAMTVAAGLQRIMQALGAYGFLGHVKKKREYLRHIPRAVRNLETLLVELEKILAVGSQQERLWVPAGGLPQLQGLMANLP